ncbi:MAG: hypothetical protein KA064_02470 [Firmicutes bacterium]|nr:hypothetical protein [Bacillota bacterium]
MSQNLVRSNGLREQPATRQAQQALELTAEEIRRYSRHLCLAGVGEEGQRRIRSTRALVMRVGGLGSPIALRAFEKAGR